MSAHRLQCNQTVNDEVKQTLTGVTELRTESESSFVSHARSLQPTRVYASRGNAVITDADTKQTRGYKMQQ